MGEEELEHLVLSKNEEENHATFFLTDILDFPERKGDFLPFLFRLQRERGERERRFSLLLYVHFCIHTGRRRRRE